MSINRRLVLLVSFALVFGARGQSSSSSSFASDYVTSLVYQKISNLTSDFAENMGSELKFCVKDPHKDWNRAFNFSSDLNFITECLVQTNGNLMQRVCTAAEIRFYFNSSQNSGGRINFMGPNSNCNLMSWPSGCEPGWSCSVGDQNYNLSESKVTPQRTTDCGPCCAGFFCPRGLTCMIPCPLGSYCPVAKLNKATGVCDPYQYQLPPGSENHTCGSADIWFDFQSSSEVFCPAGYYCPSTIQKLNCSSGHYCRIGSTFQSRCFQEGSCKVNSPNQNITLLGALLMIATVLLLLIIYNFTDQLLTIRQRRQAKSREEAARMARETGQACQRWKAAKYLAKKHGTDVHVEFSHTLSTKSSKSVQEMDIPGHSQIADESPRSSTTLSSDNLKVSKGKRVETHTQMLKYAYRQIEKEKFLQEQNKELSFSGAVAMASSRVIKTRPTVQVTFKELTLTLRRSKKQLLKCVTGKLVPGHVTAVMGPSGAGKTTFINAVAGKATGCHMTGSVLINDKSEPIRAYKKIIGFVPQDDIVHGNLTVEENLWFSAKCRLPVSMSKADKILVVERVIECLGLQDIRDSIVGTVEKRGISGGQRKRVNVGLEMVMEPSLLILDEPTSGLDSATSQLLLRALRREALEGVNICMVVHQPSYSLFQMFDELILLAKGGLLVYHGPVKEIEGYFAGLGINVPDRVNPPDYFIDILEGIVKPESTPGILCKELPVKWMLHNGYQIPPYMLSDEGCLYGSTKDHETDSVPLGFDRQAIAGYDEDSAIYNFSKARDFSNRRTPGILMQYKYFLGRITKQRLREAKIQGIDFLILWLAGICLGTFAKLSDENFGAARFPYTVIAVSLLCKIGALRSFSQDRLHYWRERSSGMSSLAYFLSKDTIDHFNTLVKPIVYLSMYYSFTNPRSHFAANYAILVALVYSVTGIGYSFAISFQPGSAQLWSALVPVVLTLVATQQGTSKILASLCYPKWAVEAFVIANAERYSGVWLVTRCGAMMKYNFNINEWSFCLLVLFAYGVLFRFIAFISLVKFQK